MGYQVTAWHMRLNRGEGPQDDRAYLRYMADMWSKAWNRRKKPDSARFYQPYAPLAESVDPSRRVPEPTTEQQTETFNAIASRIQAQLSQQRISVQAAHEAFEHLVAEQERSQSPVY